MVGTLNILQQQESTTRTQEFATLEQRIIRLEIELVRSVPLLPHLPRGWLARALAPSVDTAIALYAVCLADHIQMYDRRYSSVLLSPCAVNLPISRCVASRPAALPDASSSLERERRTHSYI